VNQDGIDISMVEHFMKVFLFTSINNNNIFNRTQDKTQQPLTVNDTNVNITKHAQMIRVIATVFIYFFIFFLFFFIWTWLIPVDQ